MITRMKTDPKFLELAKHSSHNEIEILHSKTCSCYFCRQTYNARDVNDWTNDKGGVTALCPVCGMDSVIGDASGVPLDKNLLKDLNQAFYGEDYMEKHPAAALKYVERYKQGNITHKKVNESLYIQYLSLLAGQGNSVSAYDLGQLYENGTEFTPKDPKTAFFYYGMACLSSDGGALTRLGVLSESGALGSVDLRGAYECYAKGMAMGCLEALVHFADCYSKGLFVEKNPTFAYDILSSVWPECYSRFAGSSGKDVNIFPDVAYRLGTYYLTGGKATKDPRLALRFFLYAQFGFHLLQSAGLSTNEILGDLAAVEKAIEELAHRFRLVKQDPAFDNDTFADTLNDVSISPTFLVGQKEQIPTSAFSSPTFDKETHTLSFDLTSPSPLLVVDVGNLFCGFVPGTIHWDFIDVSDVRLGKGNSFAKINGNPADGWDFMSPDEGDERAVVSIVLLRGVPGHKHGKPSGGKA